MIAPIRRAWMLWVGIVLVALLCAGGTFAEGTLPESAHPYAGNTDQTWQYTGNAAAAALRVRFTDATNVEAGWDFLYITNGLGAMSTYSGNALAGRELVLAGNAFSIRLVSDASYEAYGFKVESVTAMTQAEYAAYRATPRYTVSDGVITLYEGEVENLVIPAEIDGKAVTAIGARVFAGNAALRSVVIPDGVTKIGAYAFNGCAKLTTTDIPQSVTEIGEYAFYNCAALENVTLPSGMREIPECAFSGCAALESVAGMDGVTKIGTRAFDGCVNLATLYVADVSEAGQNIVSPRTTLIVGENDVMRDYASYNGFRYSADAVGATDDDADTVPAKVRWIVENYITDGMSEYDKAVRLHNWLCQNVQYDYQYYYDDIATGEHGVTEGGALLDGWAVCQGYADAYTLLLNEAGVKAYTVTGTGNGGGHAWNLVRIGGEWYQTDVTWDDNTSGWSYTYFCVTDSVLERNHKRRTMLYVTCDAVDANYYYKEGYYDEYLAGAVETIKTAMATDANQCVLTGYAGYEQQNATIAEILRGMRAWDGGWVEASCASGYKPDITVSFHKNEVAADSLTIEGVEADRQYVMVAGSTAQLRATVLPQGEAAWSSSDEGVCTVSETGLVRAVAGGNTVIEARCGNKTRRVYVSVLSEQAITGIELFYFDVVSAMVV